MPVPVYQVLHIVSLMLLTGLVFYACAHPVADRKRPVAILAGVAAFLALFAGIGLHHKLGADWQLWLFIKMGAWLFLTVLASLAFRMPSLRLPFATLALAAITLAAWAVYYKPV